MLQPRLLELLLQCCGLHELARTGRMMVPAGSRPCAGTPGRWPANPGPAPWPGPGPARGSWPHRVFDGDVVTPGGTVLLTVTGYRATDLGLAADRATPPA